MLSTIWQFSSPWEMGVVLGITGWGGIARAVRSQTLSLRERGFLEAARGLGLPGAHIIRRELLPNVAPFVAHEPDAVGHRRSSTPRSACSSWASVPYSITNWGVMLNKRCSTARGEQPAALTYLLAPLVCILLLTLAHRAARWTRSTNCSTRG